ncbi:EAL domain-containing protein [Photobacterium leiognathi subsp. mandapamensis]
MQLFEKSRDYNLAVTIIGTGYSSLYYLNLYDFDSLKIDKSFVDTIESSELTLHIIESIVLLASKLNVS